MIERLLGAPPPDEHRQRARLLFGQVLDSPAGGLQLTTIHGFCQNILRRFPLEAGVAPHFTVLEDTAADRLLAQAKHRLLSYPDTLQEALSLIGSRIGEQRFDKLLQAIVTRRGVWDEVWRLQSPELLRAKIFTAHGLDESATAESLQTDFCNCMGNAESAIIRTHLPRLLGHKNQGEQKMGQVLASWLECETAGARHGMIADFCEVFLTKPNPLRKIRSRLLNEKEFPQGAPLRVTVETLAIRALAFDAQQASLANAEESFAIATLARALLDLYAQAKAQLHALDYDDLIAKTRALFANPGMLGWVMSKLDHRIDHLLIDEAQDTSADQWAIAATLVEELIAGGGIGSGDIPRGLLVVGDEKQSIYSFQGAAPELFAAKRTSFAFMLSESAAPLAPHVLDISYRSAPAILQLVDAVAAVPAIAQSLSATGIVHGHKLHRGDAAGLVALHPPVAPPEKQDWPPLTIPTEYQITRSAAQMLAEQVAEQIAGWLAQKRPLASENRPIEPGDILILVHRRKPIVLPLIRALERRKIPVAGLDRLTLSEHLAVRDILALMAWCGNVRDDLALAQILRSPIIGIDDDALRALAFGREGSLWDVVRSTEHSAFFERMLARRDALPYDFLTQLLEVEDARRRFAARFGEEVHEVLDELKNQSVLMADGEPQTIAHFHQSIARSTRQIKREQEARGTNQLRIMTVHGAKGLEAPVVLMVDTTSVPTTQHELLYFAADERGAILPTLGLSDAAKLAPLLSNAKQAKADALNREYQRLLYVALTRARDELHIFGTGAPNADGLLKDGSWYDSVAAVMRAIGTAEGESYVLRDPATATAMPTANQTSPTFPPLPAWATRPVTATELSTASAPSHLAQTALSPYLQTTARGAKERGVRIHRVLEFLTADSDAAWIAQFVAHLAPDWSAAEKQAATDEIAALHAQESWLWESPALAEPGITGTIDVEGRAVRINGQVDRLIHTPGATVILDYKTGSHIPAPDAVSENYRLQLKTYRALVAQLYPAKPVRCAILWTAGPLLMWLDDAVAATPWPKQFVMLPVAA
jgi:ATP-dependent helicase/nuclease subunit A